MNNMYKLTTNELDELVTKYEHSSILASVWYAILLWYYYGSVANATTLNDNNRREAERREAEIQERIEKFADKAIQDEMEQRINYVPVVKKPRATRTPKSSVMETKTKRKSRTTLSNATTTLAEEPKVRHRFDETDNFVMPIYVPVTENDTSSEPSFSGFGGGGDFSGGGAGGSWSEDNSSTVTASMGGSFGDYS